MILCSNALLYFNTLEEVEVDEDGKINEEINENSIANSEEAKKEVETSK